MSRPQFAVNSYPDGDFTIYYNGDRVAALRACGHCCVWLISRNRCCTCTTVAPKTRCELCQRRIARTTTPRRKGTQPGRKPGRRVT